MSKRIQGARGAILSLLKTGFHGYSGSGPEVAIFQYNLYIIPIMMYGLEVLTLSRSEIDTISQYHRECLRYIMHLPPSTAIPAIHFLSGTLPLEATLHIRILTALRRILAAESGSPPALYIRELICRQMAIKDPSSKSWANLARKLLIKYQLPLPSEVLEDPPDKATWRTMVKEAVNSHWTECLRKEAAGMTSLSYLDLKLCNTCTLHPVWLNLTSQLAVRKATVKALLMVQRYPLTTSHTAGANRKEQCPLCSEEPETTEHFILHCKALRQTRANYLPKVLNEGRDLNIPLENIVKVILDSNHHPHAHPEFESLCRNMLFKIHSKRAVILGGESAYQIISKTY